MGYKKKKKKEFIILFLILLLPLISALENPKEIDLFYPESWYQDTEIDLIMKVYTSQNNIYIPESISFDFDISGITLINTTYDKINQIISTFKIDKNAKLGNQTIKLTIQDERTLEKEINITIKESKKIKIEKEIEERDKIIKIIYWAIGGLGLLIFIIILLIALMTDKDRKRNL